MNLYFCALSGAWLVLLLSGGGKALTAWAVFAAGQTKVRAMRAALEGQIINGIVTDEATARALLSLR